MSGRGPKPKQIRTGLAAEGLSLLSDGLGGVKVELSTPDVRCKATRTANQSIPNNSNTNVTFPTEDYDSDDMHSTVSNTDQLVVPTGKGGLYLIVGSVRYQGNVSGHRFIVVTINNTELDSEGFASDPVTVSTDFWMGQCVAQLELSAGDVIRLRTKQKSGISLNIQKASLSALRVGL